jgi:hypothetical protein
MLRLENTAEKQQVKLKMSTYLTLRGERISQHVL